MSSYLEKKIKINNAFKEAGLTNTCPRCNDGEFLFVENMLYDQIGYNSGSPFSLLTPTIPVVVIICKKCGFVSQHSLQVLGLLPDKDEQK